MTQRDQMETSEQRFARALSEAFLGPGSAKMRAELSRWHIKIGDGHSICLGDKVVIPPQVGGQRAGECGIVIMLSPDGLGLRFPTRIGRVYREFFEWTDLNGATVAALPRKRQRKSVTPPAWSAVSNDRGSDAS